MRRAARWRPAAPVHGKPRWRCGRRHWSPGCRAASAGPLQLKLSALGGSGTRWWFLNGAPVGESQPGESIEQKLSAAGLYQLSLLDQSGATARVEFQVGE